MGHLRLTPGYIYLQQAHILIQHQEYNTALDLLSLADEQTPPTFTRRRALIDIRMAVAAYGLKRRDDARYYLVSALQTARTMHSPRIHEMIARIGTQLC